MSNASQNPNKNEAPNKVDKNASWLIFASLLCVSTFSQAYSECSRTVAKVWLNMESSTVWVAFTEGSSIFASISSTPVAEQVNRFYQHATTALTEDRFLIVRYPEDNLECPPAPGAARDDFEGVWLGGKFKTFNNILRAENLEVDWVITSNQRSSNAHSVRWVGDLDPACQHGSANTSATKFSVEDHGLLSLLLTAKTTGAKVGIHYVTESDLRGVSYHGASCEIVNAWLE